MSSLSRHIMPIATSSGAPSIVLHTDRDPLLDAASSSDVANIGGFSPYSDHEEREFHIPAPTQGGYERQLLQSVQNFHSTLTGSIPVIDSETLDEKCHLFIAMIADVLITIGELIKSPFVHQSTISDRTGMAAYVENYNKQLNSVLSLYGGVEEIIVNIQRGIFEFIESLKATFVPASAVVANSNSAFALQAIEEARVTLESDLVGIVNSTFKKLTVV